MRVRRSRRLSSTSLVNTMPICRGLTGLPPRCPRPPRRHPPGSSGRWPCRSSSGVPEATTSPPAMTTIWSHRAATSCIMWLEKRMHLPSSRSRRSSALMARVLITSSPRVGSSSSRLAGRCTMARASPTFSRSPWEKPWARRSAIAPISRAATRSSMAASSAAPSIPWSRP